MSTLFSDLMGKTITVEGKSGQKVEFRLRKDGWITTTVINGKPTTGRHPERFRLLGSTLDPDQSVSGPVMHRRLETGQRLIATGPTGRFFLSGQIKTVQVA